MGNFITDSKPKYVRAIIYGRSGSGKTTIAASMADVCTTLLVSFHAQPQEVAGAYDNDKLVVYQIKDIIEFNDIYDYLYTGNKDNIFYKKLKGNKKPTEFGALILDGFSAMQQTYMQILLRDDLDDDYPVFKPSNKPISHMNDASDRHWGRLRNFTISLVNVLLTLDMHVITTSYERREYSEPVGKSRTRRHIATMPAVQGSGYDAYIGFADMLLNVKWDGNTSVAYIRQTKVIEADYRYSSNVTQDVLFNTNMLQLMGIEPIPDRE